MPYQLNKLGQLIGNAIENFKIPALPNFTKLKGGSVLLEPISHSHLPALYAAFKQDISGKNWTYLPYGPFANENEFLTWAEKTCFGEDPKFYTIMGSKGPAGIASYLRIKPNIGCIEIGHIHLSPLLQQTRAGTEALLLMIEWVFKSGYRRLEWKCDSLNEPSRRAAKRLGFSYEGTFRQALIYKSRNRDTAWYAITNEDWSTLKNAYQTWCAPNNFHTNDIEVKKLSELTAQALLNSQHPTEDLKMERL